MTAIVSDSGVSFGNTAAAPQLFSVGGTAASNALTAVADAATFVFRSSTLNSGTPVAITTSSQLSLVAPSGASFGASSGQSVKLYIVALNNAGIVELALYNGTVDESALVNTVAISSSSTLSGTYYSAVARSNVAVKAIGYIVLTEAVAGVYATQPTLVQGLGSSSSGGSAISGFRNTIINGNFGINQRGVSGTVTLAAGAYGHDRWKAGTGGCTYTFATTNNVTTITITAGTLMQVIEGLNLQSGTYALSWQGTAQARVDSGSYGSSGMQGTAIGGTNQTIEFGTGTVSKVQYEQGTTYTVFENRHYGAELALCQRYYTLFQIYTFSGIPRSGNFPVVMRATPTLTASVGVINNEGVYAFSINSAASYSSSQITASAEL